MKYEIVIDKNLFTVYPEIRLGLLRFCAEVKQPDIQIDLETLFFKGKQEFEKFASVTDIESWIV